MGALGGSAVPYERGTPVGLGQLLRSCRGGGQEAWPFYRKKSGVRLCWELEEPKGPNAGGGPALLVAQSRSVARVTGVPLS